jgi:hypothetical protein
MKRVRYLAGAVGLAPMALGAVAAGGAHVAAAVTGHGKTETPHVAAAGVHRHGKAVTPYAWTYWAQRHRPVTPDINRVNCKDKGDWLKVYQSSATHVDCFANAGSEFVKIYKIDYVYTGNNKVGFALSDSQGIYACSDNNKNTYVYTTSCSVSWNTATMVHISIY